MFGSSCFALGSFPAFAQDVDPGTLGVTFFVGSIAFTAAAALQFATEVRAEASGRPDPAWLGHGWTWWAGAVQLVGTLLFNLSTFEALRDGLSTEETNRLVWAPDAFGSVAFLIASALAWRDVGSLHRGDPDRSMAAWNGVGSLLFMVSAIGALTLPTTGEALNLALVNSGTFGGAVCFLFGAWLLLREQR